MSANITHCMPFDQYAKIPAINASAIKAGCLSMRHMRAAMEHAVDNDSKAMRWGRIVHLAVLEPDRIGSTLSVFDGRKAGPAWAEHIASHDEAWTITPDEMAAIMAMSQSVHANQAAHRLIEQTYHEAVVQWSGKYGAAKARLDGYDDRNGGLVMDLKTTARIEPRRFASQFADLHYDIQLGWAGEGTSAQAYKIIALESKPPYDCTVYDINAGIIRAGRERAVNLAMMYMCCASARTWPGVDDGHNEIPLELPKWAMSGTEEDQSEGTMEANQL